MSENSQDAVDWQFSLQDVRSNFHRQTKKKIFDVPLSVGSFAINFLNSGVCRNTKEALLILKSDLHPYSGFEKSKFSLLDSPRVSFGGGKICVHTFLDNQRTDHPKIR